TPPTRTVTFTSHDSTPGSSSVRVGDDGAGTAAAGFTRLRGTAQPGDARHAGPQIAILPPKVGHEMVWNSSDPLAQGSLRVCNHISVISRLAGRIQCRRPRFDHLFELRWPHIKTVVTFTINETR